MLSDGMIPMSSGWPDGRGPELRRGVEESPHSIGHGAGENPGRGNLPDRATETDCPPPPSPSGEGSGGEGEKVV